MELKADRSCSSSYEQSDVTTLFDEASRIFLLTYGELIPESRVLVYQHGRNEAGEIVDIKDPVNQLRKNFTQVISLDADMSGGQDRTVWYLTIASTKVSGRMTYQYQNR